MNNHPLLQDLQVFAEVARRGSFVAAAKELGTSTTHVSKRVALLEQALGVKLLHRTTRKVQVSEQGETVYRWAQTLLQNVQSMGAELQGLHQNPKGPLRISSSQRIGRSHIAPIVSLLQKEYPDLTIWLELVDRRVKLIEEGFDLDIRVGNAEEPGLIAHHLASSPRVLCASPDYLKRHGAPHDLQDLSRHECLVFRERDEAFGVWRLQGPDGWESVKVSGKLASNHSDLVLRWARDGHGIVMVASWYAARYLQEGSLRRVLPAWQQTADVWAMSAARSSQSAKIRVCIDFLKRELTEGEFALWKEAGAPAVRQATSSNSHSTR